MRYSEGPWHDHKEIEPNTFVFTAGHEKGLRHHYFTEDEIRSVFSGFDILDLHVDGTNHHSLLAQKIAD